MSRFITILTCLALVLAACGKDRTSEDVLAADAEVGETSTPAGGDGSAGDGEEAAEGADDADGAETDAGATPTTLAATPPTTAPAGDVALSADFGDGTLEITHGEMNELVLTTVENDEFLELAFGGVRPADLETVILTQQLAAEALFLEIDEAGAEVTDDDLEASKSRLLVQLTNLFQGAVDPLGDAERIYDELPYLQFLVGYQAGQDVLTEAVVADAAPGEGDPCVSHILVETEAEAQSVLDRLADGEDFGELAAELSTDPGSGSAGGVLGCAASSNYVPPFAAAVDSAELGEYVGPVESDFGFHVLIVDRYEVNGVEGASGRLRERLADAEVTVDDRLGTWDPTQYTILPLAS